MRGEKAFKMLSIVGLLCFFTFTACDNGSSGGGGVKSETYTVKYEITGPAIIADSVTYRNESGNFNNLSMVLGNT